MIYVSGPTVEDLDEKSIHAMVYRVIMKRAAGSEETIFPVRTDDLSKLSPADFYSDTAKRIKSANGVVTLITGGDQSTPVEASLAAHEGKPQSILELSRASRLIRGLPHVIDVTSLDKDTLEQQVIDAVDRLLKAMGRG